MTNKYFYVIGVLFLFFSLYILQGRMRQNIKGNVVTENIFKSVSSYISSEPLTLSHERSSLKDYHTDIRELISKRVPADNRELINLIRNKYIEEPSKKPYNLDVPDRLEYSNGQAPFIDSRLNHIENGFYVECGACTGEPSSNSFFFEKVRKWEGLLIEADPSNYKQLKNKHRKAFSAHACLSPTSYPMVVKFNQGMQRGRVLHNEASKRWVKQQHMKFDTIDVDCFPLYSFMLALNKTTIDYFSLDVEGEELNVLSTIPFDKLNIKMLSVEYVHIPGGSNALKQFMKGKGYDLLLQVSRDDGGVNDLIFRKKGLRH